MIFMLGVWWSLHRICVEGECRGVHRGVHRGIHTGLCRGVHGGIHGRVLGYHQLPLVTIDLMGGYSEFEV